MILRLLLPLATGISSLLLQLAPVGVAHSGTPDIPEPFTLEDALRLSAENPALELFGADSKIADADLATALSKDDLLVYFGARARWIGPSDIASDQSSDDHKLNLVIQKTLYDFGKSQAANAAAKLELKHAMGVEKYQTDANRLLLMRLYFDVLLSDIAVGSESEAMAIDFIRADKLRERSEFGEVSDIDLLEAESVYLATLARQRAAESNQRFTRAKLAEAINRPGQLPATLVEPELDFDTTKLPEYERLVELAFDNNGELEALQHHVAARREALNLARHNDAAELTADAEVAGYSRREGGNDEWRIGLRIVVPLYSGGAGDASNARARAELQRAQSLLTIAESRVRQDLLETWQRISGLELAEQSVVSELDFRELYLDRSRALYELEVKTDLGDAMVQFSRSLLKRAQIKYDMIIAWEQLKILTGSNLEVLQSSAEEAEQ